VEDGEKQLRDAIRSQKKAVIGRYDFANFVSTDANERKLATMEHEMLTGVHAASEPAVQSLADTWRDNYGVTIKYFGITKLTLPTSVTQAIFESMRKTEENKAKNYEAEGQAKAKQIVSAAEEARERIMSVANRKATEIRNEGERIVSELYARFEEHQDLRIFLDKLRTVVDSLSGDTTFILDQNIAPVDLFKLDTSGKLEPASAEPAPPRVIDRVAEGS
jgi:regulator of protease activity HflC (stomatin/prohibitin superfamily)